MIERGVRRDGSRHSTLRIWAALALVALYPAASARPQLTAQRWDAVTIGQLLGYIDHVDRQGLVASDYGPQDVRSAVESGDPLRIEAAATQSFAVLARDLARGHISPFQRTSYFIASDRVEPAAIADVLDMALTRRDIGGTLDQLAPHDVQYRRLVAALASLPAGNSPQRRTIRINLERLRWLPRDLGADRLVVNIPEYTVHLYRGGDETAAFRVIVGKTSTPTPQFSTLVTGVIVNPTWQVPQSIIAESVGRLIRSNPAGARSRGYTWSYANGGLRVAQRPGPNNSLGQVKLDMPNPLSVYLHDTPSKDLFDKNQRTFSHGCIRVDRPLDLATMLLSGTGVTRGSLDLLLRGRQTQRFPLANPLRVYVIYQTAVADKDGLVHFLDDPYGLDPAIGALLDGGPSPALTARATHTECARV